MKVSYEGDHEIAAKFLQQAQQEWRVRRPFGGWGHLSRTFRQPWGEATVRFNYGEGLDGVHIVAKADAAGNKLLSFLSGAVLAEGQITGAGLIAYAPTDNAIEKFGYTSHPLISTRLTVKPHVTMPTRIDGGVADSQYTVQRPSLYTGKMCRLVQLILGYGKLRKDSQITAAINKFRDGLGKLLPPMPTVIWTKQNLAKGVQNTFAWEWARTHGIFTRTYVEDDVVHNDHWLIEIATAGVRAMPLQIEPITAIPEFRAYVEAEIEKPGHKQYFNDLLLVLDEFGGLPSNEAFFSAEAAIQAQIVTILGPGAMPQYVNGSPVSTDHGWAFNDSGTNAHTVCLETLGDNSWHMAHHCRLTFYFDSEAGHPQAQYAVVESGSAPVGRHYLKVGSTALNACISYNLGLDYPGDYSGRPKATRTAMLVFWKRDRLEVLRWSDGHSDPSTNSSYTTSDSWHTLTESQSGETGIGAGFFCTLHDGRIPTTDYRRKYERTRHLENEKERRISYSPASDVAEWYSRSFWSWDETREEIWTGGRTNDSCAFVPLGDRSAFYLVTMTTSPRYDDDRGVSVSYLGDPYSYSMTDSYIWNWDFGNRYGWKFPVTWAGLTVEGVVDVVWNRDGAMGKLQLNHYGYPYIRAPHKYSGGGGYFNLTASDQEILDDWTARTGRGEWASIGDEPPYLVTNPFGGSPGDSYSNVTGALTTVSVVLISMQAVKEVFRRSGSYAAIYQDYNYWFDISPNSNGDFQTMWAFKNYFGAKFYQLYSTDVNDSNLSVEGGYPLQSSDFPTFIGVVGNLPV